MEEVGRLAQPIWDARLDESVRSNVSREKRQAKELEYSNITQFLLKA